VRLFFEQPCFCSFISGQHSDVSSVAACNRLTQHTLYLLLTSPRRETEGGSLRSAVRLRSGSARPRSFVSLQPYLHSHCMFLKRTESVWRCVLFASLPTSSLLHADARRVIKTCGYCLTRGLPPPPSPPVQNPIEIIYGG
jgi:hypothetical protein